MIEYITNTSVGTKIYKTNSVEEVRYSILHTLDNLCMKHLFTFDGYRKAVHKTLNIKRLIPIYLDEYTQFIPVKRFRDYEHLLINHMAVSNIVEHDEGLCIQFLSGRKLYIKMSLYSWKKQIEKLTLIRNTKVKHFH
ncbi:MAG: competence protein ComK [Acholeplasmataceae bacterium]|jgi:hypothetical protein|nr:competence protein ComK [Acholeplasmataceae bacterium]